MTRESNSGNKDFLHPGNLILIDEELFWSYSATHHKKGSWDSTKKRTALILEVYPGEIFSRKSWQATTRVSQEWGTRIVGLSLLLEDGVFFVKADVRRLELVPRSAEGQ